MMDNMVKNPPSAEILMNSMRSMGYSFEAAVADLIDNCISAAAKNIQILLPPNDISPFFQVLDDGNGMSFEELTEAMRYGSRQASLSRKGTDLGHFGLGMKSASLSQCRVLTVVSKKEGKVSALQWDLDLVFEKNDWIMRVCSDQEVSQMPNFSILSRQNSGTLVMWEKFDFIEKESEGKVYPELIEKAGGTISYLSLIFHRFLNDPFSKVNISFNGNPIFPLDPFLEKNKKTDKRKKFDLPLKRDGKEHFISIRPYVLPFQKDLSDDDYLALGGREKLFSQQGFYVYRANRLIIWGTWFKMKNKNELAKYARVMVDIPNSMDDVWGIDIKKQNATLPKMVSNQLVKAIDEVLFLSKKKSTHRAYVINSDPEKDLVWVRMKNRDNTLQYMINKESKIIQFFAEKFPPECINTLNDLLESIERCIPYQDIYCDVSEKKVNIEVDEESVEKYLQLGIEVVQELFKTKGISEKQAVEKLMEMDPFDRIPELKEYFEKEYWVRNGKFQA